MPSSSVSLSTAFPYPRHDRVYHIIQAYFLNVGFFDLANGRYKLTTLTTFRFSSGRGTKAEIPLHNVTVSTQKTAPTIRCISGPGLKKDATKECSKTQAYSNPISAQCLSAKPRFRSISSEIFNAVGEVDKTARLCLRVKTKSY